MVAAQHDVIAAAGNMKTRRSRHRCIHALRDIERLSLSPASMSAVNCTYVPKLKSGTVAARRETALSTASLLWSLLFSSIGFGYFLYGKKQRAVVPLVCGIALMVFPYFISNNVLLVVVGAALAAVPYFLRL